MRQVAEQFLDARSDQCRVCSEELMSTGWQLQSNPDVSMRLCEKCHAVCADRFPNDTFLNELYKPENYTPNIAGDDSLSRRAANRLLDRIRPHLSGDLSIVDYGGSDGNFARLLRDELQSNGYQGTISITVVDIFERPMKDGIRFLAADSFDADKATYNLILASAVLEHLRDMPKVVTSLLSKAEAGAFFYARTPFDIPIAKLGARNRVVWPRHLFDLGPEFWDHFLATFKSKGQFLYSGPSIIQTAFTSNPIETLIAMIMKAPSYFELKTIKPLFGYSGYIWKWVGGWEVVIQFD